MFTRSSRTRYISTARAVRVIRLTISFQRRLSQCVSDIPVIIANRVSTPPCRAKDKLYLGKMQSLMILGRQPELGLAELESLYGAGKIRPVGDKAAVVDVDPCLLAFDRLGGSVKFCKILTELDTTDWKAIEKFLVEVSPGHSQKMPEGKMRLGLSAIGLKVSAAASLTPPV